ncbi:hypothetical protein Pla108_07390 [Botrimarina colliarenosi]|uniref:PilZ domain-containing protein n=1 Tax=Botrimarina colliarenosi TaxID=2528001 RepID=A0A5C6AK47_9BACT|nr:PilZ domain-containing protein [Botrimarina colliarenosi]TWT99796.1 hypothetical protein Pla108_07390 [Botrimarina colliarenosi]
MSVERDKLIAQPNNEIDQLCAVGRIPVVLSKADAGYEIAHCAGCLRTLSWPSPRPDAWAAPVPCPECQRIYFTAARNRSGIEIPKDEASQVNDAQQASRTAPDSPPLPIAIQLLSNFFGAGLVVDERRQSARYALSAPVVVVPLSNDGMPVAEAYSMTLLDISASGMGLMRTGQAIGSYLLIDFAAAGAPGTQCLIKVCWRNEAHGITKLGGEFIPFVR